MSYISDVENGLYGIAKVYPLLIPFAGVIYTLLGENTLGFMIAIFSIVDSLLNVFVFKGVSQKLYEQWYLDQPDSNAGCNSGLLRPASGHPQKNNCGLFNDCNTNLATQKQSPQTAQTAQSCLEQYQIGMPSGHAQTATSVTMIMILIVLAQKGSVAYKIGSVFLLLGFGLWIIVSRVLINCHTYNQVLIGSAIGYLLGMIYYYILRKTNPDDIKELSATWETILWIGPPIIYILIFIYSNYINV